MDPNATLQRIIQAALDGDGEEMMDAAQDLADWLEMGGFKPTTRDLYLAQLSASGWA